MTEEAGNGHIGHRGGGTSSRPHRTVPLRQGTEQTKAEVPEVQGNGQDHSVHELRGERMEPSDQSTMPKVPSDRMPVKPVMRPSAYRYYLGAIAGGVAVGILWTIVITKWVKAPRSYEILVGIVILIGIIQIIEIIHSNKELKAIQAEIDEKWGEAMGKRFNEKEGI